MGGASFFLAISFADGAPAVTVPAPPGSLSATLPVRGGLPVPAGKKVTQPLGRRVAASLRAGSAGAATLNGQPTVRSLSVAPVSSFGFLAAPKASVVLDHTLGQTQQPVITTNADGQNDYGIQGTMGRQVGGNLFFSFATFGLETKESATFSGATGVQNILARVTGGAASSIDGTIRSQISGANLYLINPAGVLFGANAKLDLDGSFAVSTADYLALADGGRFDAAPSGDAALTSAPVSAFGFLSATPAAVTMQASVLSGAPGRDLAIVAGDLTLDGATVAAPGGRLGLVSVRSAGSVTASIDELAAAPAALLPAMGSIELKNGASARIDSEGGGRIVLRGGNLTLTGASTVQSENAGAVRGGDVDVLVIGTISIHDGQIRSSTKGVGDAGDLHVEAGSIAVDGDGVVLAPGSESYNGIVAVVGETGSGHGGNLSIQAGDISLLTRSEISTTTFGHGDAGNVRVMSSHLTIDALGSGFPNGIFANVEAVAVANGGDISVQSDAIRIANGGSIAASTYGVGNAGKITVAAPELVLDAGGLGFSNNISADVKTGATGHGGDVTVQSKELTILGGSTITANSFALGDGGNIQVDAETIMIDGQGFSASNGIYAGLGTNAIGHGGQVTVRGDTLSILGGSEISSNLLGHGAGGNVTVTARQLEIEQGLATKPTGIFATVNDTGVGQGGSILVTGDQADLEAGGQISASTFGVGAAGSVTVRAADISISGTAQDGTASGIFANSNSTTAGGDAGNVDVQATGKIEVLAAGEISSQTFGLGKAGNVTVSANDITVAGYAPDDSTSSIFADSNAAGPSGDAGNVTVTALGKLQLLDGGQISSTTYGLGKAGNVTVSGKTITVSGFTPNDSTSAIYADSDSEGAGGDAGNVSVKATGKLMVVAGGGISSQTSGLGNAGRVTVSAGEIVVSGQSPDGSLSAIYADSDPDGAGGNAGDVTVTATGKLSILGGAEISSETFGMGNAGRVTVTAGEILVSGATPDFYYSAIYADSNADEKGGDAGNVTIVTTGRLAVLGGAQIASRTYNLGKAGLVTISAGEVLVSGESGDQSVSAIFADSASEKAGGDAGNVTVSATGKVSVLNGGEISSETFGLGKAGKVVVSARDITVAGLSPSGSYSAIFADSDSDTDGGDAGNVTVRASGRLTVLDGGQISSETSGSGNAGNVTVRAGTIMLDGSADPSLVTGIRATSNTGATGDAGNVSVTASGQISITAGAYISASTASSGKGGNLILSAGSLLIDAFGYAKKVTGVVAQASRGSTGNAGVMNVTVAGEILVRDGGEIQADTFGPGHGGDLTVHAGSLSIQGDTKTGDATGIFAGSDRQALGRGGNMMVTVDGSVLLTQSGQIAADSGGAGQGGDLFLKAGNLTIDGSATPAKFTGIAATAAAGTTGNAGSVRIVLDGSAQLRRGTIATFASGSGNAGIVDVTVGDSVLLTDGSYLSVSAFTGQAGSVSITAPARIELHNQSAINASAGSSGGNLSIVAGELLYLDHSRITATAGTSQTSGATGAGGNMGIDPEFVILDHATISANAAAGAGGNISLAAQNFFSSESGITATGTQAGTINIAAPELDLSNGLAGLSGALVDASNQLREQCSRKLKRDFSSFLVLGAGGISVAPEGPIAETEHEEKRR